MYITLLGITINFILVFVAFLLGLITGTILTAILLQSTIKNPNAALFMWKLYLKSKSTNTFGVWLIENYRLEDYYLE